MKQRRVASTLTAALLTLVATAAYSQTSAMTANIPFAFRAVGTDLPAGRYSVAPIRSTAGDSHTMQIQNMETGKTVFIPGKSPARDSKDARPRLVFRCANAEGCSLSSLWSGPGAGLDFPNPALTASQKERSETIYFERVKEK